MACTGIEFCKLAIVETKAQAAELVNELETRLGELDSPITVNLNGCPNSCARIQVADIGLKGQLVPGPDGEQVEGFQVHLGGGLGLDAGFGRKLRGHKVTADELPDYVERVAKAYLAGRRPTSASPSGWPGPTRRCWRERPFDRLRARHRAAKAVMYCPYCAEETLFPIEGGGWECRSCQRAFSVKFLGLRTVRISDPEQVAPMSTVIDLSQVAAQANRELAEASAGEIMTWAYEEFGSRLVRHLVAGRHGDGAPGRAGGTWHRRDLPRHRLPLHRDHRHPGRCRRRPQRESDHAHAAADRRRTGRHLGQGPVRSQPRSVLRPAQGGSPGRGAERLRRPGPAASGAPTHRAGPRPRSSPGTCVAR